MLFYNLLSVSLVLAAASSRKAELTSQHNHKGSTSLRKSNTTLPLINDIPNLQARQQSEPVIVFCSAQNCAGGCIGFSFEEGPFSACLVPTGVSPYASVFISDPTLSIIPDILGVGSDCLNLVPLTDINACFGIDPPADFYATFPVPQVVAGPAPGLVYNIQNVGTGLFIDLKNANSFPPTPGTPIIAQTFNEPPTENQKWIVEQATNDQGVVDDNHINSPVNQSLFWFVDSNNGLIASDFEVFNITYEAAPTVPGAFIMVSDFPIGQNFTLQSPPEATISQVFLAPATGDLTEVWLFTQVDFSTPT